MILHLNPFKHIFCVNGIRINYLYVVILFFCSVVSFSQVKNEDELKKQANTFFEDDDYNQAYKFYAQLVSLYPKDPEYNYRLGVCMLFTEPDKKKSFSYFNIALKNPAEAPKEAKFYLAKAYHINYKFDDAIKYYLEYKQVASAVNIKKLQVDKEMAACRNGKKLLSNLSDLVVISKKQLNEADYFRSYDVKDIGGKLLVKPDEFKTAYDKKKKDKSVVYLPRTGDRLYFSSYGESGAKGKDLFFVNKLPNGSWSKPQSLPTSINTDYDEDYPFLHPNGKTLYFSSKGHNSMGGYDVFKTTFDSETQSWSKPENLDFPINSPDDDILFVTDSLEKTAFFSTGRYSPYGKIDVLKISTERRPMNFAVLSGTVVKEDVTQSLLSKITVKNMANGEIVGTYQAKENGNYFMELPNGGKFIFTVETPGLTTQSDGVQMPIAYSLKPYRQVISYENKVLKIINYFDGQIADENYSVMLDLIEKKAKLEVNENEPYNNNLKEATKNQNGADDPNLKSVTTNNPTVQGDEGTPKTNTNKNVTNDQLLSIAKMDALEAENESKKLKQDAQEAFDLATQKTSELVEIQKQIDDATATTNAITDITKKNEETIKINELKDELNTSTAIANTATNLAKKLEVDANQKQKEADLTNQYIKELEAVIKNKNNKEALAKLTDIQKQLDAISNQPNQSDELVSSIKAELDLKQNELQKSEKKSTAITEEINLIKTETETLETDLANENDKTIKENISAQIRELKADIASKNKEIENNNQKISNLQNQVTGLNKELEVASNILDTDKNVAINTIENTSNNPSTTINNDKALTYNELTAKYANEINNTVDKSNKDEVEEQNNSLKKYNADVNTLIASYKSKLSTTKNETEKKNINKEIKELEKIKTDNDKLIASNNNALNQIAATANVGSNTTNTTDTNPTAAKNNTVETNNTNSRQDVGSNKPVEPINKNITDNSAYLKELESLKNNLNLTTDAAKQLFAYNEYKENSSVILKQTANQKFEAATKNESNLNSLIENTETKIKSFSENNSDALLSDADALNTKALEQRKEVATKSGAEKDALLKQIADNENLAITKKLQASELLQQQNKNKFETNVADLSELEKLTGTKTSNDISQANMLADEAAINYNQAQKLRSEANAYPSGAAKLGGLGNAEEKENEALFKQQKAIELLLKTNPNYKVKTSPSIANPMDAIAIVNAEINKTSQSQLDAYTSLSKTNQNELSLQNDKLTKNPAFKTEQNNIAQELKSESDKLNAEAKAFLEQSATATTLSEKTNALFKANEKEIAALKKLSEAVNSLKNTTDTVAASNSQTVSTQTSTDTSIPENKNTNDIANSDTTSKVANTNSVTAANTTNTDANAKQPENATTSNTLAVADTSKNNSVEAKQPEKSTDTANNTLKNNATETDTATPTNANNSGASIAAEATNLKNGLNNPSESNLTSFNTYSNTEAIGIKNKASEKINSALTEDKQIAASLDNVTQLASQNNAQSLNQEAVDAITAEAEKTNTEAYELRKSSATKTGQEKENDLQQAKTLEEKAISKKVEAARKQQQLNAAQFAANKKTLEELAVMAKGKNISELSTAEMQKEEADLYFDQAKKLRMETDAYPTEAAKLGGYSNAEEKENLALNKQTKLINTYKKYFSNYIPKQATVVAENPEATTKLNETKTNLNTNNQSHIDGLLMLSQAIEKEYKSRFLALPTSLKTNETTLKTNAQTLYKKYTSLLAQANQSADLTKKKNLLIDANKNGQDAINALDQITKNASNNISSGTSTNTSNNNNVAKNNTESTTSTIAPANKNNTTPNTNNNASTKNTSVTNTSVSVNNKNTTPNTTSVKLKVEGLEVKNNNAYTANNPIPLDEKIQDGLVFKVQIGAFKTTLPNNTFKGLSPVIAQTTPSGYIRYMAGNFNQYESANAVKNDLKNLGYNDAFVVAYFNGKRINLNEGVAKAQEFGQTVNTTNSTNTTAGITAGSNVPKNTFTTQTNSTATNTQPVEIANELEKMNGLLYTVQIGVYSQQVTRAQLYNLRPIYTEKLPSGLYRYTAGVYNNTGKLLEDKRKVIELGVKDAFISAYYNAKRIPFAEAQKLQTENNNLKMEVENPIIFLGVTTIPVIEPSATTPQPAITNTIAALPNVTAFSNGISSGPAPTADNGVKTDETGVSYKVQIGAYKNQIPNDIAAKFMNIKTWPVNNLVLNGLYIYTIGNFNGSAFAKKLKDEAVSLGITDAFITVYKDGKKLYGEAATQYLNK